MKGFALGISFAFVAGCVAHTVAPLVIPKASAQRLARGLARWEYVCFSNGYNEPAEVAQKSNKLGSEGWEMTGVVSAGAGQTDVFCFKRPL